MHVSRGGGGITPHDTQFAMLQSNMGCLIAGISDASSFETN